MRTDRKFQIRVTDDFLPTRQRLKAAAKAAGEPEARIAREGIERRVNEIAALFPERFEQVLREIQADTDAVAA